MIKLRDAKCPNCGANIQVNEKLENTICQYCGSQVIIEEAIEKYKIELSGKVEVDGIKGRNSKLEQARKHMKIEEYDTAKAILKEIVEEDSLDFESYIELLKIEIIKMRSEDFDENLPEKENLKWQTIFVDMKKYYDRIKKLDEGHTYERELREYQEELDKYMQCLENIEAFNKDYMQFVEETLKTLNDYVNRAKRISKQCAKGYQDLISNSFKVGNTIYTFFRQDSNGYNKTADEYEVTKFTNINLDGSITGDYSKITDNSVFNSPRNSLIIYCNEEPANLEEMKIRAKALFDVTEKYLSECSDIKNTEIDKQNKKLDRNNTVINAKNKILQIRIYIDYAIMAILGLITFISIFTDGIGFAIMLGIFLDSWVFYICVHKIQDHKLDLQLNDMDQKKNNMQKREHV